jgi:hypothetical protein
MSGYHYTSTAFDLKGDPESQARAARWIRSNYMGEELPSLGISATRIENLRDSILTKMEELIGKLDVEGEAEANVQRADAVNALAEAFVGLR